MGRRSRAARAQLTATQAESQELDIESFSRLLEGSGLTIRDVSNDGNCFFRAVSDQLYGTEDYHMKLRERACNYLSLHKEHYRFFVDDEQSFEDYVSDMRKDGVWADNLELQAISMACDANIRVHQSGKPSYDIRNHLEKNARAIHLSYHFGEHYASVRPIAMADARAPAQHDPLPIPQPSSDSSRRHENSSPQPERGPRRPRRRNMPEDDTVLSLWRRAYKRHSELSALVERTRRAAKAIRVMDGNCSQMERRKAVAKQIERDMSQARASLEEMGADIDHGKTVHRVRSRKVEQERLERRLASNPSESDGFSSYSEDDAGDDDHYKRVTRRNTEVILASLSRMEDAVNLALQTVTALTAEFSGPNTKTGGSKKHQRGGKKKEQEAKKRERKERRRKEQEKLARRLEEFELTPTANINDLDIAI
eukprot:GFKZ01003289.1.p2 GENE.GFKZ01003289.1~~GFKZ01003289.1.p2  ORF type:complete len:424 (+),score=65.08 GFKZ01003289.1:555-1826(+)